jgi:flavin-dependent dehydrogenase
MMRDVDVAIVGGGPGGSSAGAMLARAGRRVLLLEKELFPRFHVGESLLPFGNEVLKTTGAWPKVEAAGFIAKLGAEFHMGNGSKSNRFWFRDGLVTGHGQTFQVDRATFDKILMDHARECGCEVLEEATAKTLSVADDGVVVGFDQAGQSHSVRARWLVDASGRETFAGRMLQLPKVPLDVPKRIALYGHFTGVERNEGEAAGHIAIVRLHDGWFWFIPMAGDRTSVGMVRLLDDFKRDGGTMEDWFARTVEANAETRRRMQHARRMGALHVTSDYTYRYGRLALSRVLVCGDAGGFVDPIFSSGVYLATVSAQVAVRNILASDAAGRGLSDREQRAYTRELHRLMDLYLQMIRMYYDDRGFEVFMQPNDRIGLVRTVNSLLAGNTRRSFSMWWRVQAFYLLCRLNRWRRIVPALDFRDPLP